MGNMENRGDMAAINKWVFFCFNYPYDFIDQIWGGTWLHDHFKSKFSHLYDMYGCNAVMNRFYVELSQEHQKELMTWVLENYNDERKL